MASPKASLAGQKFGRLKTIASPYKTSLGRVVNTQCSCGTEKPILVANLLSGRTKSCGCLAAEAGKLLSPTDADGNLKYAATREHKAYQSAMQRCHNPKSHAYEGCGGAGIKFHESWIGDFPVFYRDMGRAGNGQILIRKDLNAGYSPANCAWGNWGDFGTSLKRRRESVKPSAPPMAA
jgi:hypothetical protein